MMKKSKIIKHIYQPTGNSCGPACIFMVYEYIKGIEKLSDDNRVEIVNEISETCGTDWIVGTPPDRMEKGFKNLELKYLEDSHMTKPFEILQSVLDKGNVPMLRTITKGVPHWIIITKYTFNEKFGFVLYDVLDPWLGEKTYSEKNLDGIWGIKDYQFFEIIQDED